MATDDPSPLASVDVGPAAASRLVLVHGFTQNRDCWGPFDQRLVAASWALRLVDAPGHGRSGHATADLPTAAGLLARTGGVATWIGYSMGGRMCLRLALDRPEVVTRLVLVGATPGIEDPAERAARRAADDALATRLVDIGLDAFLDEWLAQPLFAGLPAAAAHVPARRTNDPRRLAASLRAAGTGAQEPMWARLPALTMPVLLVVGAADPRYLAIAERMRDAIGAHATVAAIPGAGHTAHLEQPDRTAEVVLDWLDRTAEVTSGAAPR
jgi:2-succinyl-6-hydroxy-2,4-cyclohexadiene-1-carboxylate synthase